MKKIWKKVAAGLLAMALVVGVVPANVGTGGLFDGTAIVAYAADAKVINVDAIYEIGDSIDFGEGNYILKNDQSMDSKEKYGGSYALSYNDGSYDERTSQQIFYLGGVTKDIKVYSGISDKPDGIKVVSGDGTKDNPYRFEVYYKDETKARESHACGENLTWSLKNGTLTISGTGTMASGVRIDDSTRSPFYPFEEQINSVKFESGVTSVGNFAFINCHNITSITIPDSVTSIGVGAFAGDQGLTSITIPDSVTSIGMGAFSSSGLTSITIPSGVTEIPETCFEKCANLESIEISEGVTSIKDGAFKNCTTLKTITIPKSVNSLGKELFTGCNALETINFEGPNPPTGISNALAGLSSDCEIVVPKESVTAYKDVLGESANVIDGTPLVAGNTYKQTAQKDGKYYTRFVFVKTVSDLNNYSKAKFIARYNGTDYFKETSRYYTSMTSNKISYKPDSEESVLFVVTISSGSDISGSLTCDITFE